MFLAVNDLFKFSDSSGKTFTKRVLWVDESNIFTSIIDIEDKDALPQTIKIEELSDGIEIGYITRINEDPWFFPLDEDMISTKNKEIRDKGWEIVNFMACSENEPDIYIPEKRGVLLREAKVKFGASKNMIYKYLRRYWQRGKTKNALLPDYINSGGIGKDKKAGDKKRGRPRKFGESLGNGINTDESMKRIFRTVIAKYYDHKKNLNDVRELMLRDYFSQTIIDENGEKKEVRLPDHLLPTPKTFEYWFKKENDIKKRTIAKEGLRKFELNYRAITGSSNEEVIGPGSRFQIDATVGDIYLVSRYDRNWIIGRPVIYLVIDVFSRMVVGLYVGLEGPSWIGACMAIANAASDKVRFCKEYDIEIDEDEWDCKYLPERILGDRGEMISKKVETLISSLGVKIENTAPYRADWKGIVERHFKTINTYVKPLVPGYIDVDFGQRGGNDYRLDAKLDLHQFTQIMIKCALYHNNQHWLKTYDMEEAMIPDKVEPIPRKLWEWGIANRSGKLKFFQEDIVKLNLMPVERVTVTESGIKFKSLHYSCGKALRELWFEIARIDKSRKVYVSYDPRCMNYIYIRHPDGRSFEKCRLTGKSERLYANKSLDEINYLLEYQQLELARKSNRILEKKIDLNNDIENIVKEAENMAVSTIDLNQSKKERTSKIKKYRSIEKGRNRNQEFFELGESKDPINNFIASNDEQDEEDFSYPQNIDLLRKIREEKINGQRT